MFLRSVRRTLSSSSSIQTVHVQQVVTVTRAFTEQDVLTFGKLVGDHNPIHSAGNIHDLQQGKPIVQGILVSSLFSAAFGTNFPGSVYLSQDLRFKIPVFIDDALEARITFLNLRKSVKLDALIATCQTEVLKLPPKAELISGMTHEDEEKELVVDGRATVLLPKHCTIAD